MGILAYRKGTFYNNQRYLLIPSITGFWRKYQNEILESLQGKKVILAGDGRAMIARATQLSTATIPFFAVHFFLFTSNWYRLPFHIFYNLAN